jgi:hypothetical protein
VRHGQGPTSGRQGQSRAGELFPCHPIGSRRRVGPDGSRLPTISLVARRPRVLEAPKVEPSAVLGRGNTRGNIILSNASNASSKPTNVDDLDARGGIYASCARLRALWTLWSVEVRVLSGALGKARGQRAFLIFRTTYSLPSHAGRSA